MCFDEAQHERVFPLASLTPFALSVSKGERRPDNGLYEKRIGITIQTGRDRMLTGPEKAAVLLTLVGEELAAALAAEL